MMTDVPSDASMRARAPATAVFRLNVIFAAVLGSAFMTGPALAGSHGTARADASPPIRVCATSDDAPYSTRDGRGFENRIAEVVAEAMGRSAVFAWSVESAAYSVRDQLEMRACDMIVGMDSGDTRVATTKPYYRSSYVFVQRRDTALRIANWDSPDILKARNIGFLPGTPAQIMLEKIGLFREHYNYMHSLAGYAVRGAAPLQVPPTRLVSDVADGTAELAVAFAPQVARYVKANGALAMTVVPDTSVRADGVRIPQQFDQSIGVRKADTELLAALDAALDKVRPQIEEILAEEGIPMLRAAPKS